jgi:CheY-like chemotaxis protein
MSAEMQARMFDPFFTTKSAGHGFGLAVVHGIVHGLDGSIDVKSEPGRGSSFVVTLPCARVDEARIDHAVSASDDLTPEYHNTTLLVVEDEESLRQAVVKLLQKRGFEVLGAADGSTAIDILRTNNRRIDLLLLDMTLPGQPSHDVIREAEQTRPGCKVLLTSAYSEEFVTATLTGPQIQGFIRKPFQLDNLLHSIRAALSS